MEERVLRWMKEYGMTEPGDTVLVGLSGGGDSVCLLFVLYRLRAKLQIELVGVHIHHGLRKEEADRDETFCRQLCEQLSLPFVVYHQDVRQQAAEQGISLEEAGRLIRYGCLEQQASLYPRCKIAVAHHRDDSGETILHHLFRGSGLAGLTGIAPVRGRIIRPLLCVGKQEILAYLSQHHMDYCTDSTNKENDYTRNRIRNQILPLAVETVNYNAVGNLLKMGKLMGEADRYLHSQAVLAMGEDGCILEPDKVGVKLSRFVAQPPVIRSYMIRQMLRLLEGDLTDVSASHIEGVMSLVENQVGKQWKLPGGYCAKRDYEILWIGRKGAWQPLMTGTQLLEDLFEYQLLEMGNNEQIPKNRYTKWFDYDKIKGALCVRYRQTGDYITLTGGGRKTIKTYMIDEKIPACERGQIPLVAEENHIIWIVGYRISEYYKITDQTKTILQIRYIGGTTHGR